MRRFLISAAAVALLAASASSLSAQPHSNHVGKASVAPEVQDRAQAELRHQAQPRQTQPPQGGGRAEHDRGGNRGGTPPTQATVQSPNRPSSDRGNWQGRDNRSAGNNTRNDNGRGADGRADRRDWRNGRDFNRDGRTDYRPNYRQGASYGGPRHDFSGFRDYHRNFNVTRRFNVPYYRRPAGWYDHRWRFGEFLPAAFWARDYWLADFRAYDLPPPPYGAVWVRVGNDALLVDEDSGEVITVAYSVFY